MRKNFFVCGLLTVALIAAVYHWYPTSVPSFYSARVPHNILVIDAGHGGEDGGAVSPSGVIESHINLAIAQKLDCILGLYGVNTLQLRTEDISLHDESAETLREKKVSDLQNRVATVESLDSATLLSIHQNIFTSAQYDGAQVFYGDTEQSLAFATVTQALLNETLTSQTTRGVAQIPDTVYLMSHVTCPAILVECGFLSNPTEEGLLQTEEYQQKIAVTLAAAYLQWQMISEGE